MNLFRVLSCQSLDARPLASACLLALALVPQPVGALDLAPADLHSRLLVHVPDLAPPGPEVTNASAYLKSLAPRVLPTTPADLATSTDVLIRSNRYASQIGYLRVAHVEDSLPAQLTAAAAAWSREEPVNGLILDLRAASGTNFALALRTAQLFGEIPATEFKLGTRPILDPSHAGPESGTALPRVPLAILVNRQTRGAAELLAVTVRRIATPAVLIGTNTAGQARDYRAVAVADQLEVQVASDPVVLPGGEAFPIDGLKPDLAVHVSAADEALYLADEFQRVANGRRITIDASGRLNEAELVRRRRGLRTTSSAPSEPPPRGVQDPALGRAIDLLDALVAERRTDHPSEGDSR